MRTRAGQLLLLCTSAFPPEELEALQCKPVCGWRVNETSFLCVCVCISQWVSWWKLYKWTQRSSRSSTIKRCQPSQTLWFSPAWQEQEVNKHWVLPRPWVSAEFSNMLVALRIG